MAADDSLRPKLDEAVAQDNAFKTEQLLVPYKRVNARDALGRTLLAVAAHHNSVECARVLLAAGARPNRADALGRTPLHHACARGNEAIVKVLVLEGRADVLREDRSGDTPYKLAKFLAYPEIMAFLREAEEAARSAKEEEAAAEAEAKQQGTADLLGGDVAAGMQQQGAPDLLGPGIVVDAQQQGAADLLGGNFADWSAFSSS